MTTPDRTEDLLRLMLERRAGAPPPGWLLPGVAEAVRGSGQVRGGHAWSGVLSTRRFGRMGLVAAAALVLLALAAGVLVAARLILPPPQPTLPAIVVLPSPSATLSPATPEPRKEPTNEPQAVPAQSVSTAWTLPPGWEFDLACNDNGRNCLLHLYDETGREQEGWPVAIPGFCQDGVAVGPQRSAFVACTRQGQAVTTGLDQRGKALPGWPVRRRGSVAWSSWSDFAWGGGQSIGVGPDGTVYVAVNSSGGEARRYTIHALAQDATPRKGWPRRLPGSVQGFALATDDSVLAWWYEGVQEDIGLVARRTAFTKIGADGRTLPGWPIGSKGAASGPVAGDDGSIFYVSATGKVWGHDRTGRIIHGWPYQLATPIAPQLRPDGTLMFIDGSGVVVLDQRGSVVPGWPFDPRASLDGPGCDTPSFGYQPSAIAEDGRLFLASWDWDRNRASIFALKTDGRTPDGWPYRVPEGWRVVRMTLEGDGTLSAGLTGDPYCGYGIDDTTIRLTAAGELIGDAPPTPLNMVYEALRVEPPHTTSGSLSFPPGASIEIRSALVNRSTSPVILPHVIYGGTPFFAAGTWQTWIERMGPDPTIDCPALAHARHKRTRYATGGWISVSLTPLTIEPRGEMDPRFESSLSSDLTQCLPPGAYRYHIEYRHLDDNSVIDKASIDLAITGTPISPPSPTPGPTPVATPKPTPTPTLLPPSPAP